MRWCLCVALGLTLACGDDDGGDNDAGMDAATEDAGSDVGSPDAGVDVGTDAGAFELMTSAFEDGGEVPLIHRCGPPLIPDETGMNVSPALTWTPGPAETMSYAMVVRDQSAGGLVHWVIYDIPAELRALPERVPAAYMPLAVDGARQGEIQGSGYFGYFGPCSGGRGNMYVWTLHAMPVATLTGAERETTENDIASMVEAMSIATASFSGTY